MLGEAAQRPDPELAWVQAGRGSGDPRRAFLLGACSVENLGERLRSMRLWVSMRSRPPMTALPAN